MPISVILGQTIRDRQNFDPSRPAFQAAGGWYRADRSYQVFHGKVSYRFRDKKKIAKFSIPFVFDSVALA